MSKKTQNYIDSQQHWENNINDDYYLQKQIDKQMEKDIEKQIYNEWEKQNKMSKQTAVEWIQQQVKQQGIKHYFSLTEILEQAKQMEKEQIIEAYNEGNRHNGWALKHEAEKYYNETYKKEDK